MKGVINFSFNFGNYKKNRIDYLFLISVIAVTAYGTLMVFSAGSAFAQTRYGDGLYFVKRQAIWLILGFAVMYIASVVPIEIYKKYCANQRDNSGVGRRRVTEF